jgi:hypothetical protein
MPRIGLIASKLAPFLENHFLVCHRSSIGSDGKYYAEALMKDSFT